MVELFKADPATFESVSFNLARDKNHAWYYGKILPGVDAASLQIVNSGFVWKDDHHVWYQHKKIAGADPVTFKHLEQAFYRDAENVYWSSKPLEGADPKTFRTFGDDSAFGADNQTVWRGGKIVVGVDAATFAPVHQSVYKDKHGVYGQGASKYQRPTPKQPEKFGTWINISPHFWLMGKATLSFCPTVERYSGWKIAASYCISAGRYTMLWARGLTNRLLSPQESSPRKDGLTKRSSLCPRFGAEIFRQKKSI